MDNKTNKKLAALMLLGAMSCVRTGDEDVEGDEMEQVAEPKKSRMGLWIGLSVVGLLSLGGLGAYCMGYCDKCLGKTTPASGNS